VLVCVAVHWVTCDSARVRNAKSLTAADGVFRSVTEAEDGWRPMAAKCSCRRLGIALWFCTVLYTCCLDRLDAEPLCKDAMIC